MDYQVKRQISVALENRPGLLAQIAKLIGDAGVNIEGISVIDNVEQGMVRLVVSDCEKCRALLREQGFYLIEAVVIEVFIPNEIGSLAQIASVFADRKINIDYAYGTDNQ